MRKDGSIFPMRLSVGKAENSLEEMYIGVCHDLTDYQNALIELAKAEQRYKSIVECQGQIICRLDQDFKLTFANRSFQRIFQCLEQEILGMHFINFIPGDKREMQQVLQEVVLGEIDTQIHFKTLMLRKTGRFNIEWWFSKVLTEEGITEIQGFGIDVSEKEEAIRQATFLKNYDVLTGLLNLDAFTSAFATHPQNERYGIFYLDCNHFGLINNRYGFDLGDKMLVEAARRLKRCVKKPALLCRPGADEFIFAIAISDPNEATQLAECMIDCLTEPYQLAEHEIRVSGKIGIALYPDDGDDINQLIRKAESVLARAKQSPNAIACFDEHVNTALQRQLDVEQSLRIALEQSSLQVYLQPKVALATEEIIGYEALLRWHDAVLGQVSPLEFIKVAEAMGLATKIDRFVLTTVFNHLARCLQHNIRVQPIAVNITSTHFNELGLTETIFELHRQTRVPLSLLELEITEGVLLEMTAPVKENLSLLRHNGIKIAIDDFGTGYSSLSYVKQFTVDAIKIDKSFIDDLSTETGRQLLSAVIAIAKALKLSIVAEGVETAMQKDILLKMGCEMIQGYFYAKPLPINEVMPVS